MSDVSIFISQILVKRDDLFLFCNTIIVIGASITTAHNFSRLDNAVLIFMFSWYSKSKFFEEDISEYFTKNYDAKHKSG